MQGLTGPVAVSVVMAQWDESVDAIHAAMDWTPPVAFLSPAQKMRLASSSKSIAIPPALPVPSAEPRPARLRFIIAPGNGGCGVDTKRCNFYGWLHVELEKRGHESICVNWPGAHHTKPHDPIQFPLIPNLMT